MEKTSTAVKELGEALSEIIATQAKNMTLMANGNKEVKLIDKALWTDVVKMVKEFPNLDLFEKIVNGEVVAPVKVVKEKEKSIDGVIDESGVEETETIGNIFEMKSREFKENLLNGKTNN